MVGNGFYCMFVLVFFYYVVLKLIDGGILYDFGNWEESCGVIYVIRKWYKLF